MLANGPAFNKFPSIYAFPRKRHTYFIGNDGNVLGGTVASRRWLFNGTVVGTGTTLSLPSNADGRLVLEVTASGTGGPTTVQSIPMALWPFQIIEDGAPPVPTAPNAFAPTDWTFTPTGTSGELAVGIISTPSGTTNVKYRLDGGSWVSRGNTLSFNLTGKTDGQTYSLELIASNSVGDSPASTAKTAAPATVPAAPTLALTPSDGQVSIAWTDGATGGSAITARRLYRSTTSGFTPGPGNLIATSPTFPYADTGLTNGTAYYYKGIAANVIGDSAASTQQSATPSAATGGVFTGVPSIAGSRGGTLTGTPAPFSGTDTRTNKWLVDGVDSGNNTTSFNDTDPSKSVEYRNTLTTSGATVSAFRGVDAAAPAYQSNFAASPDGTPLRNISPWAYFGDPTYQDSLKVYGGIVRKTSTYPFEGFGGGRLTNSATSFIFEQIFKTSPGVIPLLGVGGKTVALRSTEMQIEATTASYASTLTDGLHTARFIVDDVAKTIKAYVDGILVPFSGGSVSYTGSLNTNIDLQLSKDDSPFMPIGSDVYGDVKILDLAKIQVVSAVIESRGGLGQYRVVISGLNAASSASQYRIELPSGQMVAPWTGTTQASGAWTASFDIPDYAYQTKNLVIKARNVGGTVTVAALTTGSAVPPVSRQKMRVSINDSGWGTIGGNTPTRDIAKYCQVTLQPIGLPINARSVLAGPGDEPGDYAQWNEEYNPALTYPAAGDVRWRCMYQGIQYEALSHTPGFVPINNPPIPGAAGPYWRPVDSGIALSNLVRDDTTGLIYRHPLDPHFEVQIELPWFFPEAKYPFTISGAALDADGNPVTNAILEFTLNPNMTLTSQNAAAGTFVLTTTRDQNDAEGSSNRILIKRTGGVVAELRLTPSFESGAALSSAPKRADLGAFASGPRNMQISSSNQSITFLHKPTLAKRLKPRAMGWTGEPQWEFEVEQANLLGKDHYVNIPYFASATYVTAYATYLRDNFNSAKKIRVEFCNENWQVGNPSFYQGILLYQEATAASITPMQMQARKHNAMMAIFESVFAGQTDRLIGVFAWQTFTSTTDWAAALNFENCYQHVKEISTAPYFATGAMNYDEPGDQASTAVKNAVAANDYAAFVTAMRADMTAAIAVAVGGVKTLWDWLQGYVVSKGLPVDAIQMNSYEANAHAYVRGAWPNKPRAISFYNTFKYSSNMSDMWTLYLDTIATTCPHHVFAFDYAGGISRGALGIANFDGGFDLMKKTGNLTDNAMAAVINRATYYNAL